LARNFAAPGSSDAQIGKAAMSATFVWPLLRPLFGKCLISREKRISLLLGREFGIRLPPDGATDDGHLGKQETGGKNISLV
jgi:hypothetical protein